MVTVSGPRKAGSKGRKAHAAALARAQRRRLVLVSGVAVLALAAVAALAFRGESVPPGSGLSAKQTAFVLPGLDGGGQVRLAAYPGRPVVVNFFASWCVFCNEELPGFAQVAKATSGRVAFIGVDTDETGNGSAMAQRFDLASAGFALARDLGPSPASQLWASFGGQGLPETAFYDARGRLVDFSDGMLTESALSARIEKDFGLSVRAADAATVMAPVIPVIPRGGYELLRSHAGDGSFAVLDVRPPAAFAARHLPQAVDLDFTSARLQARRAGLDKAKSYVLYSTDGVRGARAAAVMHRLGFLHLYVVQGGLAAWLRAGLPTEPSP